MRFLLYLAAFTGLSLSTPSPVDLAERAVRTLFPLFPPQYQYILLTISLNSPQHVAQERRRDKVRCFPLTSLFNSSYRSNMTGLIRQTAFPIVVALPVRVGFMIVALLMYVHFENETVDFQLMNAVLVASQ